jgi:glycosyltransferase involved in cell wall biosynthesis
MRVLICHNYYQQAGGEDQVFAAEVELLRGRGHAVETFIARNDDVEQLGKLQLAGATLWNRKAAAELQSRVRKHRAQIVHFHNTFPLLSPAVYWAARAQGAAVVQTLHNYRLLCPASTFFRNGKPCEQCLGHLPVAGVVHGCYRGRAVSAVTATMLAVHRVLGTYSQAIDAYIAMTPFAREKFLLAGFVPERVHVKPNFLDPDPGPGSGDGGFALFVGRLTQEKGIDPLLAAWRIIGESLPLKICGIGPLADTVANAVESNKSIQWLGQRPLQEVIELMGRATLLVFPSLWYEGFPRTIVESLARGTPVVASELGSMKELIVPEVSGALFTPDDAQMMAKQILRLAGDGPGLASMRAAARVQYLDHYTAERNYLTILEIYRQALSVRHQLAAPQIQIQPPTQALAAG